MTTTWILGGEKMPLHPQHFVLRQSQQFMCRDTPQTDPHFGLAYAPLAAFSKSLERPCWFWET